MLETTPLDLPDYLVYFETGSVSFIVELEVGHEWGRHAYQLRKRAETSEKTLTTATDDKHRQII